MATEGLWEIILDFRESLYYDTHNFALPLNGLNTMKGFVPSLRFPSLTATQTSSVLIVNGLSFSYAAVNVLPPPRVVVRGEGCLMNSKPEVDCDIIRNGEINQLC